MKFPAFFPAFFVLASCLFLFGFVAIRHPQKKNTKNKTTMSAMYSKGCSTSYDLYSFRFILPSSPDPPSGSGCLGCEEGSPPPPPSVCPSQVCVVKDAISLMPPSKGGLSKYAQSYLDRLLALSFDKRFYYLCVVYSLRASGDTLFVGRVVSVNQSLGSVQGCFRVGDIRPSLSWMSDSRFLFPVGGDMSCGTLSVCGRNWLRGVTHGMTELLSHLEHLDVCSCETLLYVCSHSPRTNCRRYALSRGGDFYGSPDSLGLFDGGGLVWI